MYKSKSNIIILDCDKDKIKEVLIQAQQVSLVAEGYYYLLTSLDSHTVDLEPFKVNNITKEQFEIIILSTYCVRNVLA